MQVRVAKADAHFFNKLADHAALVLVKCSQLLKQFGIDLNL